VEACIAKAAPITTSAASDQGTRLRPELAPRLSEMCFIRNPFLKNILGNTFICARAGQHEKSQEKQHQPLAGMT
jgi:hypothetical protein